MRLVLLALLLASAGCVRVPAVARGTLAQSTLREPAWPLMSRQGQHVQETREGTRGAGIRGGGGCGCN